ncbi:MAG: citrulline utilization hydrolase CtlX, partial [Sphingobacterium sp.]
MQTTDTILLVRPYSFRRNEQTAIDNHFQASKTYTNHLDELALVEFDRFARSLIATGLQVIVLQDQGLYDTPDSIFPNNTITFHQNKVILYPMFAPNRRNERAINYIDQLKALGYNFQETIDYTSYEKTSQFLEGSGAIVFDHINKIAYCSISQRADPELFELFCKQQGYQAFPFHASQRIQGELQAIYHTNVMMSVGSNFCVICLESIVSATERNAIAQQLVKSGKEIIEISMDQMAHFAGNILEVKNTVGEPIICLSEQALLSFTPDQIQRLESHGKLCACPLTNIEQYGGGSARCM